MDARLGITTCDKCQQPMTKGQTVITITEGSITNSDDVLTFDGSCVYYAYHLDCWNGFKKVNDDI